MGSEKGIHSKLRTTRKRIKGLRIRVKILCEKFHKVCERRSSRNFSQRSVFNHSEPSTLAYPLVVEG